MENVGFGSSRVWILKSQLLKFVLALGSFIAGMEELFEAFFLNIEGIFELYHAVILVSFIHILNAVEWFFDAKEKTRPYHE